MKKFISIIALCFLLSGVNQFNAQPTPEKDKMAWWREARFGMFIHFGLYTVPSGVYNGEMMGRNWYAEWIRMQGNWPNGIPDEEYRNFAKQFNPKDFNADEWIRLAREAGMKYFLITAKHHDGFALWPTKVSKYNVVDATPFKRDILGELASACKKYDVKLGFYYSHWQDWGHEGGAMPPWPSKTGREPEMPQPTKAQFGDYWNKICLPQVKELIENYDPWFFWFDTWGKSEQITHEKVDELIGFVRKLSDKCLINSRIAFKYEGIENKVDYLSMMDNSFPDGYIEKPWETSGTMNRSWGYHQLDYGWKPVGEMLRNLVANASRNGNYQLNIGPMADGTFPKPSIKRLKEIGAWMDINGEGIYGAKPNPVAEQEWGYITAKETKKGTKLYLFVFDWAESGKIKVKELLKIPTKIQVLETGEVLKGTNLKDGLEIILPEFCPDFNCTVITVEINK
ncbi:MAG: alpha-L-fucosidase [Cytophagales bacterium]|nr:alpha-L-fucosidase [Cytophagales bacterium]